jgi:hypothetical protein
MSEKCLSILIVFILVSNISVIHNNDHNAKSFDDIQTDENQIVDKKEQDISRILGYTPRAFTANQGQLENDEVLFYDQGGGVWFTADGVWFELREYVDTRGRGSQLSGQEPQTHTLTNSQTHTQNYQRIILQQEFVGANNVRPVGRERLSWNSNFFYGNDSSKWCTDVPNYAEVWYENIYDSIDLRYYSNKNGLKYDFIVHPGAEPEQIKLKYAGADKLEIDNFGNLLILTNLGNLVDGDLFCYQVSEGKQKKIESRFKTYNDLEYGFTLNEDYNAEKVLIIDPVLFSTYIGGTWGEAGSSITVDCSGNIYLTGSTGSSDFPITPGAYSYSSSSPYPDVFVTKMNPYGSKLLYSTFIGGRNIDGAMDILVDSTGNAIIAGTTYSTNFPSTPNAYDPSYNEPNDQGGGDCFILKLNHNGSSLIFSTFIGSSDHDNLWALAMDPEGNLLITGDIIQYGPNNDFPITTGAINVWHPGQRDAFISKISKDGTRLLYSGIFGGERNDWGVDITTDSNGNAYITGTTGSYSFPITDEAYDNTLNNDNYDCYLIILNLSGNGLEDLLYSSYIGGSTYECGISIVLDSKNNAIITGRTKSGDFPTTGNAIDNSYNGDSGYFGMGDAFLFKLNAPYLEMGFSTYIGGSIDDLSWEVCLDKAENILVSGYTNSPDFPTTEGSFDRECQNSDGFFCKISKDGSELIYSSFLGGAENDSIEGMWYDDIGILYLTGFTQSQDFNTTSNAYSKNHKGYNDTFVFAITLLPYFNFTSVSLLDNEIPTDTAYAHLKPYTFRVNLVNTISKTSDINGIKLTFVPEGANVQLSWNYSTGEFTELYDPNDYVTLNSSSRAYSVGIWWTFDFNITFNWTYPTEDLFKLQLYGTSKIKPPIWLNATRRYHVENDLVFNGTLSVIGEDHRQLKDKSLVRGGEKLSWSGLRVVYEDTVDIFPPDSEYDISIWDHTGHSWKTTTTPGDFIDLQTTTPLTTVLEGVLHVVNITGIPTECDHSNCSIKLRIDGDNVVFFNPYPGNRSWHIDEAIPVGISVMDLGGGLVDGGSIKFSISSDNGKTYGDWISAPINSDNLTIESETITIFEDGMDNMIKWSAFDNLGNGPAESEPYSILVDTIEPQFYSAVPDSSYLFTSNDVSVGITVSDNTSGVNVSSIEYSISINDGITWDAWEKVQNTELDDGNIVNLSLDLTLPNGTKNRIRWRAYDVAGNGLTISNFYPVNVWTYQEVPKVRLVSPGNNTLIDSSTIKLAWELVNYTNENMKFDLYFDIMGSPTIFKQNITDTTYTVNNLTLGETYYWMVVPKLGYNKGICLSGIWRFTIAPEIPVVKLFAPKNGSSIDEFKPTLFWYVSYGGFEQVKYDIYIYSGMNLTFKIQDLTQTEYIFETGLKNGETYYWQVVPRIGSFKGKPSERWVFTVDIDIEIFDLELSLSQTTIELKPGESSIVKAKIFNLGKYMDKFILKIYPPTEKGIDITIIDSNFTILEPQASYEFDLEVYIANDAEFGKTEILVEGVSLGALENNLEVKKNKTLTIVNTQAPATLDPFPYLEIIILIIIIFLIIIIIIYLILRKKRRAEEEELPAEQARAEVPVLEEKPVFAAQAPENKPEQVETTPAKPQLPTIIPIAKAVSSDKSVVSQPAPPTTAIAQPVQAPQLPPGAIEIKDNITQPEVTNLPPGTQECRQPETYIESQSVEEITVTLPTEQQRLYPEIGSPSEITITFKVEPGLEDVNAQNVNNKEEKEEKTKE